MASPLAVRFGRNLWCQRRRADLSQQELADLAGLHRVTSAGSSEASSFHGSTRS
jgi:hypothetical protein